MNSLILALLASTAVAKDSKLRSPEAPSQQCADDAGAPWVDDKPGKAYYAKYPRAVPLDVVSKRSRAGGLARPAALLPAAARRRVRDEGHQGGITCGCRGGLVDAADAATPR